MTQKKQHNNYQRQGSNLRTERSRRKLTQSEVAKILNLDPAIISAIERGQPNAWQGAYSQGYVRSYGNFLDIKIKLIDDFYQSENLKREKISDRSYIASKLAISGLIAIATVVLLGYVLAQIISLVSPPPIKIINPKPDLLTKEKSIEIKGRTNENVEVAINGVSILTAADGNFKVDVPLNSGINQFDIVATNRLKKVSELKLNVIADYQIDTSVDK